MKHNYKKNGKEQIKTICSKYYFLGVGNEYLMIH